MAKKNTTQTSEGTAPAIPPRKTRKLTVVQPELMVEIEACKKRISSLKSLNKLTPVIDQMDKDALSALQKIVLAKWAEMNPE